MPKSLPRLARVSGIIRHAWLSTEAVSQHSPGIHHPAFDVYKHLPISSSLSLVVVVVTIIVVVISGN
jgi:hypothetical protein